MNEVVPDRVISCPICGGLRFGPWRFSGLEACAICGHIRKTRRLAQQMQDGLQQPFFDERFVSKADAFTRLHEFFNNRRRLRELRQMRPSGRVLEVGVGRGTLIYALHDAGYVVEGLDLSPDVCTGVSARYGLPVYCGTLESYADQARASTVDLVVMCHVLEHIESFLATLDAARRLLARDGLLYVAVPNVAAWQARLPGWTGYEPYHIHYFNRERLGRALRSSGFQILRVRTHEPISGWFNAVSRTLLLWASGIGQDEAEPSLPNAEPTLFWSIYNVLRIITGLATSPLRWAQSAAGYGEELVMIAGVRTSV